MAKKKKKRKRKKKNRKKKKKFIEIPETLKVWIWGVIMFLIAVLMLLSFFEKAGILGNFFMRGATFLIGKTVFITPLLFVLVGILFLGNFKDKSKSLAVLAIVILIIGLSGILSSLNSGSQLYSKGDGGLLGLFLSNNLTKAIGLWGALSSFSALIIIGSLIIIYLFRLHERNLFAPFKKLVRRKEEKKEKEKEKEKVEEKPLKEKISSKFKVEPLEAEEVKQETRADFQDEEMPEIESFKGIEFKKPPLNLLAQEKGKPDSGNIKNNSAIIKRTLRNFDIEVEMSEVNVGPTVTQYTLKPAQGVKLSRIEALNKDLALALARHPIRIEAPIPGRSLVGIEVPNEVRARVRLRSLFNNSKFKKTGPLTFGLGKDVSGEPFFADLGSMPHLLIAGSTGSGKTICLNSIILSLLYKNGPQSLRLILVDPKRVEFPVYNKLPHLLGDVIFKADQAVRTLKWLISEMERRFDLLSEKRAKDITAFNEGGFRLPYIVLIIDELADLMAAKGKEVEDGIVRLAQMARAVGIHLIVATQRPSVEVITGLIKANITSRIAFQVASQIDSRTVFDMAGAEKLLGSGDMLFVSSKVPKPKRIQGSYVSRDELKKVVNWIEKNQALEETEEEEDKLTQELKEEVKEEKKRTLPGEEDELYEEAKEIVMRRGKASASLLQRRMRIGYARAARIIDALEKEGVIGPSRGSKPREVFDEEF